MFIVFEGIDGCGKTTLSSLLMKYLIEKKRKFATKFVFPDRTSATGLIINKVLANKVNMETHMLHLLFSANRYEKKDLLSKLIAKDAIIICDRYLYSGIAYSTTTGCQYEFTKGTEAYLPKPDYVIYLDIHPKVALARGKGNEVYENIAFQTAVYKNYKKVFADNTIMGNTKLITINANNSIENIIEQIINNLNL